MTNQTYFYFCSTDLKLLSTIYQNKNYHNYYKNYGAERCLRFDSQNKGSPRKLSVWQGTNSAGDISSNLQWALICFSISLSKVKLPNAYFILFGTIIPNRDNNVSWKTEVCRLDLLLIKEYHINIGKGSSNLEWMSSNRLHTLKAFPLVVV